MKLHEKIKCIGSVVKNIISIKGNDFSYVLLMRTNEMAGMSYNTPETPWKDAVDWGYTIGSDTQAELRAMAAELLTGIADGISYSIAEDMKKSKQGVKAD